MTICVWIIAFWEIHNTHVRITHLPDLRKTLFSRLVYFFLPPFLALQYTFTSFSSIQCANLKIYIVKHRHDMERFQTYCKFLYRHKLRLKPVIEAKLKLGPWFPLLGVESFAVGCLLQSPIFQVMLLWYCECYSGHDQHQAPNLNDPTAINRLYYLLDYVAVLHNKWTWIWNYLISYIKCIDSKLELTKTVWSPTTFALATFLTLSSKKICRRWDTTVMKWFLEFYKK